MRNIGSNTQNFPVFGYWSSSGWPDTGGGSPDYYGSFAPTLGPGGTYSLASVDTTGWSVSRYYTFVWNGVSYTMSPSNGQIEMTPGDGYFYLDVYDSAPPDPDKYIKFQVRNLRSVPLTMGVTVGTNDLGTSVFEPGLSLPVCLGPYTEEDFASGHAWEWEWRVEESGLGATVVGGEVQINMVSMTNVFASGSTIWGTNCEVQTTIVEYGSTNQNHGIEWNAMGNGTWPTNTATVVNTNMTNLAAINQIGFDSVVQAINRLGDRLTNSGSGGTTVHFGEITNQLNATTGHLAGIAFWSSNAWRVVTNQGMLSQFGNAGTWSNTVVGDMVTRSNSAYGAVLGIGSKLQFEDPNVGSDVPETSWTVPMMNGERLSFGVPWGGGQPVEGTYGPGIQFPTWVPVAVRALLALAIVVGLWFYVAKDAITQWRWLLTVGQVRVMKAQVMGTSIGLPVSLTIAAIMLGGILAVPVLLTGMMEVGAFSSLGSVSSNIGSLASIATGHGVWGIFREFVPVTTAITAALAAVAWWGTSNAVTSATAVMFKAFVAD